jgi:hypothetical protein
VGTLTWMWPPFPIGAVGDIDRETVSAAECARDEVDLEDLRRRRNIAVEDKL